jgi:hypothetical protein
MKREAQKMSWEEWVDQDVSKDMQADPMFAGPTEEVSQGVTFDWDQRREGRRSYWKHR